jgi:hypothetical protein
MVQEVIRALAKAYALFPEPIRLDLFIGWPGKEISLATTEIKNQRASLRSAFKMYGQPGIIVLVQFRNADNGDGYPLIHNQMPDTPFRILYGCCRFETLMYKYSV